MRYIGIYMVLTLFVSALLITTCDDSSDPNGDDTPFDPADTLLIAYCYQPTTTAANHMIYTIRVDGSENQRICNAPIGVNHHDWHPDGTRLIYQQIVGGSVQVPNGGNADLYTCAIDGSAVQQLTNTNANEWTPSFSPDGSRIAYCSDADGGDFDIWMMNADGSNPQAVTANNVNDYTPRFSPDGTLIAFASEITGDWEWEVYVINPDGTNRRRVTRTPSTATAINPVFRP